MNLKQAFMIGMLAGAAIVLLGIRLAGAYPMDVQRSIYQKCIKSNILEDRGYDCQKRPNWPWKKNGANK